MDEPFDPDHATAPDSVLAAPPAAGPVTPLALFVCTYVARLGNLHAGVPEMTERLGLELKGAVLAVNSNFGHFTQLGWAGLLKRPPPSARRGPQRSRQRRVQGDGSCFNSAVELTLRVPAPGVRADKVYRVKCFPSTGETQIPGVVRPDLADGRLVLQALVDHLNALGAGDRGPDGPRPVVVLHEEPKMLNYKFRLVRRSPRVLVNLRALAALLAALERGRARAGAELAPALRAAWPAAVPPPFPIRETKPPTDDVKVSFRFSTPSGRAPRANVFQTGKINILGADSEDSARAIHTFFSQMLAANWARLVGLRPRRDADRPPARGPSESKTGGTGQGGAAEGSTSAGPGEGGADGASQAGTDRSGAGQPGPGPGGAAAAGQGGTAAAAEIAGGPDRAGPEGAGGPGAGPEASGGPGAEPRGAGGPGAAPAEGAEAGSAEAGGAEAGGAEAGSAEAGGAEAGGAEAGGAAAENAAFALIGL